MSSLESMAETADRIAATSSRLEKRARLAEYLGGLNDADLYWAAVFFTGSPFPRTLAMTPGVGYAQLRDAVLAATGAQADEWEQVFLRWSDVGDAARELYLQHGPQAEPEMTLEQLAGRYRSLADAPAGGETQSALVELFRELGPASVRIVSKILTSELRIGLKEAQVEEAIAACSGAAQQEVREAHQRSGDIGEVALAARHGRLADLTLSLFVPLKPMLATAETRWDETARRMGHHLWIEDKYDGIRAQAHAGRGCARLFSRDLKDVSAQFPEVIEVLRQLPGELILDGELLVHRDGRARPFGELQKRLGRKNPTARLIEMAPAAYFAFDLLYQNGESLLDCPLRERRARLDELPQAGSFYTSPLRIRPVEQLEAEFEAARARANEGLMVKDPASTYQAGRRGMSWLKYKKPLDPLDVVVTGVEYGHGRRREVLSDYTFAVRDDDTGALLNIGKAYSGLSDEEIATLTERFRALTIKSFGRFQLVQPEVVVEVAFEAIQKSPRHKSGYALRFPRIVRVRPDRTPADVNTLADVRSMYERYRAVYESARSEHGTDSESLPAVGAQLE